MQREAKRREGRNEGEKEGRDRREVWGGREGSLRTFLPFLAALPIPALDSSLPVYEFPQTLSITLLKLV